MAEVRFVPPPHVARSAGWPIELVGDGFIHIYFHLSDREGEAVYRDAFGEEYLIDDQPDEVYYAHVRED